MYLPRVGAWGLLNLVRFLDIGGQVHWHKKCSKCAQTFGAYARYCNGLPEVLSRTGIARLWRNRAGYRRWAALAGVITLAMAAVCKRVCMAIGAVSGVLFTLGGGWSTVWGTLDLVRRATGSYWLVMDGTVVGIGEALGF